MATKQFLLPDLGEGLTEGEIVRWLVAVGDRVDEDQPVAEIETAKAVVEVPSPFAGTVARLHGQAGDAIAVGAPLLTVEAPAPAVDEGPSGSLLVGYGTGEGRPGRRRGPAPGAHPGAAAAPARPLAKPPVRRLARQLGVDLAAVHGSGPGGVITREDVEAYARDDQTAPEPAGDGPLERVPLRGVRRRVAEKTARSRREIPEALAWLHCDASALWQLCDDLNATQSRAHVSALAVILRACVAALREFPRLNARLDTERDEVVLQRVVHLGFAAATDRGLLVPVIKRADRLSTLAMAAELNRLAAAARDGTITPAELTGGTFTVSNYGSLGVDGGSPVINHPEVAILGVGRIADRPWVHDGRLAVRKVVELSLAFDHRVCDGADAGGFLRLLAGCLESPATLVGAL